MQSPKKYTNKLIDETSPYLLQHAHNPVDWYPWGDEAFAKAAADDKPVLVSIGYSACHWCHVMEHESFEDEETARVMNENFVNIKVDMEERPDVDQIYMNFVQLTTGRGGWPMNVFLTPEKLPFFGGTYFPPADRYNMPSWQRILTSIADAWNERRDELLNSANEIAAELKRVGNAEIAPAPITNDLLENAYSNLARSFDAKNGGFGGAPKFPQAMLLDFLLRYWKRTGNENALEIVKTTAVRMAGGGIYDQVGGGFHRYAVDAIWLVPHFEKMLYDNAQLIRLYLHLYQIARSRQKDGKSGDGETAEAEFFKRIAVETLDYVRREMLDREGGFYSSQDADSEGVEGKFFVWTPDEVVQVLGEDEGRTFNEYYGVTSEGNFEGENILNRIYASDTESAQTAEIPESVMTSRAKLFKKREKRIKPFRDEKVLTACNGLMLAAFAEAAAVLDSEEYLNIAKRNAGFLLANLFARPDDGNGGDESKVAAAGRNGLLRTWKSGRAKLNGYIEDYANLADGLIELYQASGNAKYLFDAERLADAMIIEFWDEENGGFFFISNDHEELIVRNKDFYDNATPAGNSVAADILLKLAKLLGEEKYERFAVMVLRLAASRIATHPQGFGRILSAAEFYISRVKEIVVIGEPGNGLERAVFEEYLPNKVVALTRPGDQTAVAASDALEFPAILRDRKMIDGKPTAYICEDFVCKVPVTNVDDLRALL